MLASYEKNQSIYEDLINDIRSNQHEYTIRNPSDKMYTPMEVDEFFKKNIQPKKDSRMDMVYTIYFQM